MFESQGILFREVGQGTITGLGGQQLQVRVLTLLPSSPVIACIKITVIVILALHCYSSSFPFQWHLPWVRQCAKYFANTETSNLLTAL